MTDHVQLPGASFETKVKTDSSRFERNQKVVADLVAQVRTDEEQIRQGGGDKATESQHKKGRLTARERIALLIDPGTEFFELGSYVAWGMYEEWGGAPSAGVVTGLARVQGRLVMLIVNDATVKAGRVLSDDGEEGHSRAEHRHRESHSHDLPGRLGRRVPAVAGRCLP